MASKSDQRVNLHDLMMRRSFDHAVICTFTFEPEFFEEYCLEKFRALATNANVTVFVDRGIYDEILLGDETSRPKQANLRYLLFPMSVRAIFHPKVFLFASRNRGLLVIGSANFTRSGLTQNAEMVAVFEFEVDEKEQHKRIFQDVFQFLIQLGARTESNNVESNLQSLAIDAEWITSSDDSESPLRFHHNLTQNLWEQVIERVQEPVENVSILSKYFDLSTTLLDTVKKDLNPKKTQIFTQNGHTNLSPTWLDHSSVVNRETEIFICNYEDDGYLQPLHAKALAITSGDQTLLAFGSANFTSPALLRTSSSGNLETFLTISLPSRKLNVKKLFDPGTSAVRLIDGSILQRIPNMEESVIESRVVHEIDVYEAESQIFDSEDVIALRMDVPSKFHDVKLRCRIEFENQSTRTLPLHQRNEIWYHSKVTAETKKWVDRGSTIVFVEAFEGNDWSVQSNRVLLTNLKDIKTDKPLRRERAVREAQQGISQFFSVLRDLLNAGDEQAILSFLNFCDIPLTTAARPRGAFGGARPEWQGRDGMRSIGARNLKIYRELHDAAMAFFDRHLKKLLRHIESSSLGGVHNFMHILLAIGGILQSQSERIVSGLEAKGPGVTTIEWADCRDHLDIYFSKFRDLMNLLSRDFLLQLAKHYSEKDISEQFLPDLQAIGELCSSMLSFRERVETVRVQKLRFHDPGGKTIIPGYFHSILGEEKWKKLVSDIEQDESYLENAVLRAA